MTDEYDYPFLLSATSSCIFNLPVRLFAHAIRLCLSPVSKPFKSGLRLPKLLLDLHPPIENGAIP